MDDYLQQVEQVIPGRITGSVARTEGVLIHAVGFNVPVGAEVRVERQAGEPLYGEVVGFREGHCLIYPFSDLRGVRHRNRVELVRTCRRLHVGNSLKGRVVNAHGRPIDGGGMIPARKTISLERDPPDPISRPPIDQPLATGVRAIDGMLTCGVGQRMGIFAGAGVGKSVLLGMMARNSAADVNVIGLIGERGREVNEFISRDLGELGLKRSVVVVATSDQPALMRVHAALTASAIAEFFRDQGCNVLLMMDSLTRVAIAQREIGLTAGEPPTTRGYPPSVFALLPRLVERAGRAATGSITGFYSVLVEGDDTNEPISDTVRGLLDGHTVLSRDLATQGHFPAIDILASISRLMTEITDEDHLQAAMAVRRMMSVYHENEDLITIGAYRQGSNPEIDQAIAARPVIEQFLKQGMMESTTGDASKQALIALAAQLGTNQSAGVSAMPSRA